MIGGEGDSCGTDKCIGGANSAARAALKGPETEALCFLLLDCARCCVTERECLFMPIDIDPLAANGVPHWFSVLIRASALSTDSLRIMAMPSRVDSLPARVVDVSILRSNIEHTDISAPPPPPPADIKFR